MFGYVRPRRDQLNTEQLGAYQAAYCGLCRDLGRRYGFAARFLVSYDMTFLYLLRSAMQAPAALRRCWCPARICGKKACAMDAEGFETVSACTVILTVEKLRDNIRDEGFLRSLPYRLLDLVYRRAWKNAVRRLPDFAALTREQLAKLHALEEAKSPSIDAAADAFARIVAGCGADLEDPAVCRPMEQLLYQTGRFLYLADALDDLKKDCEQDAYNPLRYRFSPENGSLTGTDLEYLSQIVDGSVNLAGAALALLPIRSNEKLLENIVYLGLPTVFHAVKTGSFQARQKPWQQEKTRKHKNTGDTI